MAASGLLLAIVITNDPELDDKPEDVKSLLSLYWTDILQKHSTYKMNDLLSTVQALANLVLIAPEWKYKVCYNVISKYIFAESHELSIGILYDYSVYKA